MDDNVSLVKTWLGAGSINIFGLPFAGKDTQAEMLSGLLGAPVISSGRVLREGNVPEHVRASMDSGHLIPSQDFFEIVVPYLNSDEYRGKPLILSSFGKSYGEEAMVIEAAEQSGHPQKVVIFLTITESEAQKRWLVDQRDHHRGSRADDLEESFMVRFEEYRDKTMPVIEYYRSQDLLLEVDGMPDKEAVTSAILLELASRASASP